MKKRKVTRDGPSGKSIALDFSSAWQRTTGGMSYRHHRILCPLDHHGESNDRSITVFVREVVDSRYANDESQLSRLNALLYLQGGPGFECTREGIGSTSWINTAAIAQSFRVFLMDQRGTGYSSPLTVETIMHEGSPTDQLALLKCFRADSIVADAEACRMLLLNDADKCPEDSSQDKNGFDADGIRKWTVLGQSYGGFCCFSYLSKYPKGLYEVLTTGGVPPVGPGCTARMVYEHTMERVKTQTAKHYKRFPADKQIVREVVTHLKERMDASDPVRMPSGSLLSPRYIQALGIALGQSGGSERLHFLFERAWERPEAVAHDGNPMPKRLSYDFLKRCDDFFNFDTNPLYLIMHESIYCNGHESIYCKDSESDNVPLGIEVASKWAAQQVLDKTTGSDPFVDENKPVMFTGEMVFPFMLEDIVRLRPLRPVAELLANESSWSTLYDEEVLRNNRVPVASASYYDDMFVDVKLSQETIDLTRKARHWVTSEYQHSGLRDDGSRILTRLLALARNQIPPF